MDGLVDIAYLPIENTHGDELPFVVGIGYNSVPIVGEVARTLDGVVQ